MNVVLAVGGGIAAYKAAELARLLMERGCAVNTVMTRGAQEFIAPLTFAALTGRKVITDLFGDRSADEVLASSVEHIQVARENQLLLVAPATADLLAKFAHGLADDFLTTLHLAFRGPILMAPAMNTNMWEHAATQANLAMLRARGVQFVEPGSGLMACGTTGPGRLAEPAEIAAQAMALLMPKTDLSGETVLITAGPTQEAIDPVRFISNRSSGKMGYAMAEDAARRGAQVILVTGPVNLEPPAGVTVVRVRSASEMRAAVLKHLEKSTIVVKSAAVADYYIESPPAKKVKKAAMRMSIELSPTPDILAELGRIKGDRLLIGFAAETENLAPEARRKLETKNADMIVGNLVGQAGIGFESDQNEVILVTRSKDPIKLPKASKREIASRIWDHALELRLSLHATTTA
jgi:phosphopantothenoylcysteine decarboxylase / phosphopantothenate---cysteine ligase